MFGGERLDSRIQKPMFGSDSGGDGARVKETKIRGIG